MDDLPGGYHIYKLSTTSTGQYQGSEVVSGGAATSIATSNAGGLTVVSRGHQIYTLSGNTFVQMPGAATSIANYTALGNIPVTGTRHLSQGYEIYLYDPDSNTFQIQGGEATTLGSGFGKFFFLVSDNGEVYQGIIQ